MGLFFIQALTCPERSKVPKVRWTGRIFDVSGIVEVNIALIIIIPCTEWECKMSDMVDLSVFGGGKSFENALDVVPVKDASWWEGIQRIV